MKQSNKRTTSILPAKEYTIIKVEKTLRNQLKSYCSLKGISVQSVVHEIIEEFMEKHKDEVVIK